MDRVSKPLEDYCRPNAETLEAKVRRTISRFYMIRKMKEKYNKSDLEINLSKTEYFAAGSNETLYLELCSSQNIHDVKQLKYLSFTISKDGTVEDKMQMGQTRTYIRQLNGL